MTREEAIKLVKRIKGAMVYTEEEKEALETLIPELRESEDERIREELIGGLMWQRDNLEAIGPHDDNTILPGFTMKVGNIIDYLRKQKEQKEIPLMNGDADMYFDEWNQQNQNPTKRQCFEEGMKYAQRLKKGQDWNKKPCLTCQEYEKGHKQGYTEGCTAGYNKAMKEVDEQKEQKPELYYDKELDSAAREFYFSGGAYSPVDSTGLVPIVRMAEFGATWMKKRMEKGQKPIQPNIEREYIEKRLRGLIDKEGEYYRGAREELAHLFYILGGQPSQYLINNIATEEQATKSVEAEAFKINKNIWYVCTRDVFIDGKPVYLKGDIVNSDDFMLVLDTPTAKAAFHRVWFPNNDEEKFCNAVLHRNPDKQ